MFGIEKEVFEKIKMKKFFWLFGILATVNICLAAGGALKVDAAESYRYDIHIHADYTVGGCKVSGDDVVCKFNVIPDKNLDKQEGYGNPSNQKLYIDIEPTNNSYMEKVNEAYLGYWQPWSKKLQDRQTPSYTIRAKKGNLKKEEIKGDITTIKYTTSLCFHVDLHWNDITNGYVTHGVSDFCKDIEASETVSSAFKGRTKSDSTTTDWVNESTHKIRYIEGCSAADGCTAEFMHSLKRTAGYGSADYEVSRSSNYWRAGVGVGVEPKVLKSAVESFGSDNSVRVYKETVKLVPGQVVCESMYFRTNSSNNHETTSVCVVALGTAETTIDESVKNSDVQKYRDFKNTVYAKPSDRLTYRTKYRSWLQYAYYLDVPKVAVNGDVCTIVNTTFDLGYLYSQCKDYSLGVWKNAFSVSGANLGLFRNYNLDVGDTGERIEDNSYTVSASDVGKNLTVTANTNMNEETRQTPSKIVFKKYSGHYELADVKTDDVSDDAKALVPYNFTNETKINSVDSIVYAGEEANISYEIITRLRYNSLLDESYATVVKSGKWKVEICYGDSYDICYWSDEGGGNLHDNNDIYEEVVKSDDSTKTKVDIPDLTAGSKIRVRSAVYPKDSGSDDNIKVDYYDINDLNSWAYSDWVELTVAKKPSFQVWGGSVYSAGDINELLVSEKKHLEGYNNFKDVTSGVANDKYTFGSWTELGLVADGTVKNLASGAGLGYVKHLNNTTWPRYIFVNNDKTNGYIGEGNNYAGYSGPYGEYGAGGGKNVKFCEISSLSFANNDCSNGVAGQLGGVWRRGDSSDKSALVSRFDKGSDGNVSGVINLSEDDESKKIDDIYYYRSNGGVMISNLSNGEISRGKTKVVIVDGSVYINGDIKYQGDGYGKIEEVPKVIIYTKGNITIDCQVERVDAVLIADGGIDTCNSGDVNAWQNSTQLKINGSVIADTLSLNRTYGGATGANSIIPAEIINYDASLYLWANGRSDITRSGKIVSVYQQELSPRY